MFVGKIFAGKSSYDSDSPSSLTVAASKKVLVPGGPTDGSPPLTEQLEAPSTDSEDPQVCDMRNKCSMLSIMVLQQYSSFTSEKKKKKYSTFNLGILDAEQKCSSNFTFYLTS